MYFDSFRRQPPSLLVLLIYGNVLRERENEWYNTRKRKKKKKIERERQRERVNVNVCVFVCI